MYSLSVLHTCQAPLSPIHVVYRVYWQPCVLGLSAGPTLAPLSANGCSESYWLHWVHIGYRGVGEQIYIKNMKFQERKKLSNFFFKKDAKRTTLFHMALLFLISLYNMISPILNISLRLPDLMQIAAYPAFEPLSLIPLHCNSV